MVAACGASLLALVAPFGRPSALRTAPVADVKEPFSAISRRRSASASDP